MQPDRVVPGTGATRSTRPPPPPPSSAETHRTASAARHDTFDDVDGDGGSDPWDQLRRATRGEAPVVTAEEHREKRRERNVKGPKRSKGIIMSRTDPLILECRRLLREQVRKREEVVRVEGPMMIETCLAFGWVPDIILCGSRTAESLERLEALHGHELQVCTDDVVRTTMSQPRLEPAVAFGPVPGVPENAPRRPQRALLLGAQDPNNVGSLLRTGLAMGVDTVYMLPGTPDPFNPAVLRASVGAAMALRLVALCCGGELPCFCPTAPP